MVRDANSLAPAIASHMVADLGAMLAAWFRLGG
jgi:hypothetical protein